MKHAPITLSQRILAGDYTMLPDHDHFSIEEWRREAQACHDCEDDEPLFGMLAEARTYAEHHDYQWRYERRTGRCGDDLSIEEMSHV